MFCEKDVYRNFAKFTGKHLCQTLFFNEVATLRPASLLKKRLWHKFFRVNFVKFLRIPFFIEHLWWLLLEFLLASLVPLLTQLLYLQKYLVISSLCMQKVGNDKIFYLPMIPRKHLFLFRRGLVFTKRTLATEHLA